MTDYFFRVGAGTDSIGNTNLPTVANITELRALPPGAVSAVYMKGYSSPDGYGAGIWRWDPSSNETDNVGTIVAPNAGSGGRWKRVYDGPVNITWFGARGDGTTTTQSTYFNAAINYVGGTLGGGTVFVPKGVYIVQGRLNNGDQIKLRSNIKLEFEAGCTITTGAGAVVTFDNTYPDGYVYSPVDVAHNCQQITINNNVEEHVSDVLIEGNGLMMVGSKANFRTNSFVCIVVGADHYPKSVKRITVRNINCYNAASSAITLSAEQGNSENSAHILIEGCTANNSARNGFAMISGYDLTYKNCWAKGTFNNDGVNPDLSIVAGPGSGGDAEPNAANGSGENLIRDAKWINCKFSDSMGPGLVITSGAGANRNTRRVLIDGCVFENNGTYGLDVISAEDIVISNCTSRQNGAHGYFLSSTKHTVMTNCYAMENGHRTPGTIPQLNAVNNESISINNCIAKDGYFSGFQISGFIGDRGTCEINSCHSINNAGKGITLTTCSNAIVNGCFIKNNDEEGIEMRKTTNCTVSNNYVVQNSQGGSDLGGDNIAVLADAHFNNLVGNTVRQASTYYRGTAASGTSTTVVLPATASAEHDFYNGMYLRIVDGYGASASNDRTVVDYNGDTKTITVAAWAIVPDNTSVVQIGSEIRPRYGIRVFPGSTSNSCVGNDCFYGGGTAGFSDSGTSTNSSGNRST